MIAFIDPKTQQIRAVYSHDTESTAWTDRGYVRLEVDAEAETLVASLGRDGRALLRKGRIVGVEASPDPEPPRPNPKYVRLAELKTKLADDTISETEMRELLKTVLR